MSVSFKAIDMLMYFKTLTNRPDVFKMYNLYLHKQCALLLMCTLFSASSSSMKYVNTGKNMGLLNTYI